MPRRGVSEKLNLLLNFNFSPPENRLAQHTSDLAEELFDQLEGNKGSSLFLGQFTADHILLALDRFGISQQIDKAGFTDLSVHIDPRDIYEHRLTFRAPDCTIDGGLLGEIVVKTGWFSPTTNFVDAVPLDELDLIFIEWMLMQHPGGEFTDERQRLPGQNWPGLGVGRQVMKLMEWVCRRLEKDGLLNFPEYYHNALFYSEMFHFYSPQKQAEIFAIHRDLTAIGLGIADISFAAYFDCLLDINSGAPHPWRAEEQIFPVSRRMKCYFLHPEYQRQVDEFREQMHFSLDEKRFAEKKDLRNSLPW